MGAQLTWHGALVQTRWMVDGKSYLGLTDIILSTWSLEGPSAFFKGAVAPLGAGLLARVVAVAPQARCLDWL